MTETALRGIDLLAFADSLPETRKELRGLIRDTRDLHSAYSDLKVANDLAARALEFETSSEKLPAELVEECTLALLTAAAVIYARATRSKSDHRKTFDIRSQLDERELGEHDLICNLRNEGFAHFGPGPLGPGAKIRQDLMILPVGGQQVMFASEHLVGSHSLAHLIRRQSQRAMLIMFRRVREHEQKMVQALNEATEKDPSFAKAVRVHEIDLAEALGDATLARKMLAGPRVGSRRFSSKAR